MGASGRRKKIAILGSTGSIGTTALELIARFPERFDVVALAAGRQVGVLAQQIERFRPAVVSIAREADADRLRSQLGRGGPEVLSGKQGLAAVAAGSGADLVLSAMVGAAGLEPTLAAIDAGIDVGLANKEVMVVAGELVRKRAEASGARVLPVDSEHNAIFQALEGRRRDHVRRLVLTASGGPFRSRSGEELAAVTREEALAHPTWDMGAKITIDSATMMNKGLEVIEARWLFDVPPEAISVVVHPQSIVHSMVEYRDGSLVAVMAIPDMTIPIAHVLAYPDVLDLGHLPRLDLAEAGALTFEHPDPVRFPCLDLAYRALAEGGTMPAVANAANEVAVARFLDGQIRFTEIAEIIRRAMDDHQPAEYHDVAQLLEADAWARRHAAASSAQASAGV